MITCCYIAPKAEVAANNAKLNKRLQMKFITTQKMLAEKVGCSEVHISKIKARKVGLSEEMAMRLSVETNISPYMWSAGPKPSLKKQLREFFEQQKMARHINLKKSEAK